MESAEVVMMNEGMVQRLFRADGRELDSTDHAAEWIRNYHQSHNGEWPAYKVVRRALEVEYRFAAISDGTIRNAFVVAGRAMRDYRKRTVES